MKMMTFRKYAARVGVVALCSAALCTVPMVAQGGGGGGMGRMTPDMQLDNLDKVVSLTSDQKPQVKAIFELDAKKRADLMAAQDPDMRAKMTGYADR